MTSGVYPIDAYRPGKRNESREAVAVYAVEAAALARFLRARRLVAEGETQTSALKRLRDQGLLLAGTSRSERRLTRRVRFERWQDGGLERRRCYVFLRSVDACEPVAHRGRARVVLA